MANPHKGEAAFQSGGKTYTLKFSADAICRMEASLDKGIVEIGREMASWGKEPQRIRLSLIRAVFWAGLHERHPDIDEKTAGELLLQAGGLAGAASLISKAFELAFPAETKGARPPKAGQPKLGTGPVS